MAYSHWRLILDTSAPPKDKASKQGMTIFFFAETRKVPFNSVGQKTIPFAIKDYKGPILEHYMPKVTTINSEADSDLPESHLKSAVR